MLRTVKYVRQQPAHSPDHCRPALGVWFDDQTGGSGETSKSQGGAAGPFPPKPIRTPLQESSSRLCWNRKGGNNLRSQSQTHDIRDQQTLNSHYGGYHLHSTSQRYDPATAGTGSQVQGLRSNPSDVGTRPPLPTLSTPVTFIGKMLPPVIGDRGDL